MPKVSAGILMYRKSDLGIEVLLAHPGGPVYKSRNGDFWAIPKGEMDEGESHLIAVAKREFLEETNIVPPTDDDKLASLGEIIQPHNNKHVHIWAYEGDLPENYEFKSNTFQLEWPPHSGKIQQFPENDAVKFFELNEAKQIIWPTQVEFLERLEKLVQ